jgi:hypothetical protein
LERSVQRLYIGVLSLASIVNSEGKSNAILRDGIPGTGMQSVGLTLLERLEVISHLNVKGLQQRPMEFRCANW